MRRQAPAEALWLFSAVLVVLADKSALRRAGRKYRIRRVEPDLVAREKGSFYGAHADAVLDELRGAHVDGGATRTSEGETVYGSARVGGARKRAHVGA